MTKAGRNDPCPCGSGKKFKKCCELPKQRKILSASILSSKEGVGKLSSLFKNNIKVDLEEKKALSSMTGKISTPGTILGQ